MRTFLGIGLGPIQTGIFLLGGQKNFDRMVVADVDAELVEKVRRAKGVISINIAEKNRVVAKKIDGLEIFNPAEPSDIEKLVKAASEADEICTALPSVKFFDKIATWLKKGFALQPERQRLVYTAENHNHAAEILSEKIGSSDAKIFFLNTVIGKMSGIVPAGECESRKLEKLTPDCSKGHLVEEFNKILISECPGIENRKVAGLTVKKNLLPFEEAKLYGHNAVHFLLGIHASEKGLSYMQELSKDRKSVV